MDVNEKKLAAEARNAYARKWRAANPDKVRANNANYWLRRAVQRAKAEGLPVSEYSLRAWVKTGAIPVRKHRGVVRWLNRE